MGYTERHLGKNETIIREGRVSWARVALGIIWFPPLLAFVLLFIRHFTDELTLTSTRVVGKTGLIKTKSLDCKLDKVQSVSVSNGLWGKLFGYGTVAVTTAGSTVKFPFIHAAEKLKLQLLEQMDIAQEEKSKRQAQEMAAAMASVLPR